MKKDYSTLKTHYFHEIDTKEKAYWLGFLYADGYVNKAGSSMSLNLADKDEDQIDRFLSAINLPPSFKRYYGPYKNTGKFVQIAIANREFVSGLIENGCTNRKTFTAVLPDFKNDGLDLAFLLGYYDGDGTAKDSTITCGNLDFLESIKNKYSLSYEIKHKINKSGSAYILNLGMVLKNLMGRTYEFSMERKKKIYHVSKLKSKISKKTSKTKTLNFKEEKENLFTCSKCQNQFIMYRKSLKFCSQECYKLNAMKFDVSKEELRKLISENSYTKLGKMFGVSGNAIKKRAKKLGILNLVEA